VRSGNANVPPKTGAGGVVTLAMKAGQQLQITFA
jgi:hypothetical protein